MGYRSPTVTCICETCGRKFHPWHANKPGRFCSRDCAPRGRRPSVASITCATCGVLFRPIKNGRTYCSRQCYRASGTHRHLTRHGYVMVYAPDHPNAYKSGQYLEHRLVMETVLGRLLERDETVHHINGDKADNRPENLQVHSGRHGKGVAHRCKDCGSTNIETVPI